MSSESKPNAQGADDLEAAVDQAITACGGDLRVTIRAQSLRMTFWSPRSRS